MVTKAHVCDQLAQSCYMIVEWLGVKPMTQLSWVWVFVHLTGFPLFLKIY